MKTKTFSRLIGLVIFAVLLFQNCDKYSFGEDEEVVIAPTGLVYSNIANAREFSYIETSTPTVNVNGKAVTFEIVSIKKDETILDATYMNSVSILNSEVIEYENPIEGSDETLTLTDLGDSGKIIIEGGNPFGAGDYYFTIKVSVDGTSEATVFEDAFHLNVGPALAAGLSYCPIKYNFMSGGLSSTEPGTVVGGNPDVRFELGSDTDKLTIDPISGVISINPSYSISGTEYLYPIINVVSNISDEVVSFENLITIALSTTPVEFEQEINYFFYPTLKPSNNNVTAAGGNGYSVEMSHYANAAGWIKKQIYKKNAAGTAIGVQEALDTRADAGVTTTGLSYKTWGPTTGPSESWMILDPVNVAAYTGCYTSKLVFWVKQGLNDEALNHFAGGETPFLMDVFISGNYSGDVNTTDWTQINDILTCKIGENGDEFTGTPYPLYGTLDPALDANWQWVKCELDLADYGDMTNFTLSFKNHTSFDTDIPFNLRAEFYISDLHFVASEIQ